MSSIPEQKAALRKRCRAIRAALGEARRARASLVICEKLEAWEVFQRSAVVLAYLPMKAEASLTSLFKRAQKRWVLPRVLPQEGKRMAFHPYVQGRLVAHPFGMMEPDLALPLVPPEEIELALVPGLAFDRRGWRLGYGGGYYDRFLAGFAGISAGIVFDDLLLDEIPRAEHDVPVQWIVTENEVLCAG